jgi:hypothetical protein
MTHRKPPVVTLVQSLAQFSMTRRRVIGGLLASSVPAALLSGCGSGDNGDIRPSLTTDSDFNASTLKPLATLIRYSDTQPDAPVQPSLSAPLDVTEVNFTGMDDRFARGAQCRLFTENTSATIASIADFPLGDFALTLWLRSAVKRRMEVAAIDSGGSGLLTVELNRGSAISIASSGEGTQLLSFGSAGQFNDGRWHHVAVQVSGGMLQLFVDGIARGEVAFAATAAGAVGMRIGGGGGTSWLGGIDDVRIHARGFSARRIVQLVYQWALAKPDVVSDAMIAFYRFSGDAINSTGKGFDGVMNRVTDTQNRFGHPASAFDFNGVDSSVEIENFLPGVDDFAIAFWARSSAGARMAALSFALGEGSLQIAFNGDHAIEARIAGVVIADGAAGELTNAMWHFVVLQRAGATLELYVDGVLRGSSADSAPQFVASPIGIGAASDDASAWLGQLDDFQFYARSFSLPQVQALEGLLFRPRDGAGAITFAGRMWLLGGWNPDEPGATNSEVWSSTDGIDWRLEAEAPWEGRHSAGYVVNNGRMWIVGGDLQRGHYQNDVWSSADGVNWEMVTDTVPWAERATHMAWSFNNRIWVLGGQQLGFTDGTVIAYHDVYSSADGVNWRLETPAAPWSERGLMIGSVIFQGFMWLLGGGTYDVRSYNNDIWRSRDGIAWQRVLEAAPWSPRQFHNTAVFDGKMWVVAGSDAAHQPGLADTWYSDNGVDWVQLDETPWPTRHAASVFVHDNQLWIACGGSTSLHNDVWRLGYAP